MTVVLVVTFILVSWFAATMVAGRHHR